MVTSLRLRTSRPLFALLAAVAVAGAAHAQVFVGNGSFEQGTATTITDWTLTPPAGPGTVADYPGAGTSIYGDRFLTLNPGAGVAIGSATSDFGVTDLGVEYQVDFVYGQFGGTAGDQVLTAQISDFSVPNIQSATFTNIAPSTSFANLWRAGSFRFFGTGLSGSLTFTDAGSLGFLNSDLLVDNVTVRRVDAVPEPATLAALGLGAVALLKRRRRG